MHDLIFSFSSGVEDTETIILIESIRNFAGKFSNAPIWLYTLKSIDEISKLRKNQLDTLDVTLKQIDIDKEKAKFPFVDHVKAAAQAEEEAVTETQNLVYLGTNSIIIQEPSEFILKENIKLGYRPVHHKLIGSNYDEPLDAFWNRIYDKCNVTEDKVFPMQTHVDGNILRPYINSGYLIVKPKKGFLRKWWEFYKDIYNEPFFEKYYQKDELYLIFIHQAVLSGIFLSHLEKSETKELPFEYNYPINLYHESTDQYRPKSINNLVTARYYLNKLLHDEAFEEIPFEEPLKNWLKSRIL